MSPAGDPALVAGARTPICRAGGDLRGLPATEMALAVARSALESAGLPAGKLGALVVAAGFPAAPGELALAARLADALGADSATTATVNGAGDLGLGALGAAIASFRDSLRPALVVGVESCSRAPYWSVGLRWGRGQGEAEAVDPVGATLAAHGRRAQPQGAPVAGGSPGRAAQDEFARRSARLIADAAGGDARGPLGTRVAVGGVDTDDPASPGRSAEQLAALKPLFDESGSVTVAGTALPADGAAAVVLASGDGPSVGTAAATAAGALEAAGLEAAGLAAAEIYEATAAEALQTAAGLGIDPGMVNVGGGAIGQGSPFSAAGVLMALRLGSRLGPGERGLLAGPGWATLVSA